MIVSFAKFLLWDNKTIEKGIFKILRYVKAGSYTVDFSQLGHRSVLVLNKKIKVNWKFQFLI